jgi:site-specific recombinase XerD
MLNYDNRGVPSLAHPPQRGWKKYQHRLLTVLQQEEVRHLTIKDLCRYAGVSASAWYKAIKKPPFVEAVEALGVTIKRQQKRHLDVTLAIHPEEELAKDIWDMRRLKPDYPKHRAPYDFKVDFTWIANPILRQQIKAYLRLHLGRWKATTFPNELWNIKLFLKHLPQEMHLGMLDRKLVEEILPRIHQLNNRTACKCLRKMRAMLTYMATSSAWTGPRPPRDLIWKEDIPSAPHPLPRPIPPDVLDQFDPLLEQAVEAMKNGQNPPSVLSPSLWDAFLILRRTGIRVEDLAHLKAPDQSGRHGCLDQDSDGYWWLRIHHHITKMGKDHRLPTKMSDGVVDAVRRQYERIKAIPDHFEGNYLFRREKGVLTYDSIKHALRKLAHRLAHEGKPYCIAGHQFRHTIATDMIEMGVDIYTVKEFLGHSSLAMTERYVQVYLTSLKAKYDAYRAKKQHTSVAELMANQVQITHQESEVDGGWLDGKVGKLYLSPLPDGAGNCAHLPMHDPCPDVPHCPTCPKLRASMRHLPMWENKVKNLRLTVEALRANPLYERARQKHEQQLRHAESVVETIRREGFWDGRIHNSKTNTN